MIEEEDFNLEGFIEDQQDSELYEHHRIVVDPGQSLLRIDKFLMHRLQNVSRNKIQLAAIANSILVNDDPVKSNYRVKPLDVITVVLPTPPRDTAIYPENIPLTVVYEDDDLIIINKKPGMVVHPGFNNYTGTLVNALAWHFEGQNIDRKEPTPCLVHRIDKNTSGLMVVAKNETAMAGLAQQFFDHSIERTYNALVWGDFEEDSGTIRGNLARHPKNRLEMTVFEDGSHGKEAVTHYRVLERFHYVTLVECKLETGRTHQIRAHMRYIGHPIFNDDTYGGDKIIKGTTFSKYKQFIDNCFELIPRQALHAKTLGFIHPGTQEKVFFDSNLPEDFMNVLDKWRRYIAHKKDFEE
ncbi:RluA family pseudouridine synthase [Oscillatoria amoena NRMC-F 0135]|nr:MAG: RluA family pseudouridine synthase [Bacteroidota bacterium]MDL5045940.1 RluA family pseudouridine synthase [Oscillatoria amoena NRMC-F 0135]